MGNTTLIKKIKDHALNRVEKYISGLSIREQQLFINEVIRYYDQIYDSVLHESHENSEKDLNFIDFSLPIAFRYLYKDYNNVKGCPLTPSTPQSIQSVKTFLDICFKAGLMENYEELLRFGVLKYELIREKNARLSYMNTHYSIERYEKTKSVKYSHAILNSLGDEYIKGFSQLPRIIKKMEKLVYTWNYNFIGYDADPEVDHFFIRNAQLDFVQATEWDGFSPTSEFGGIEYHFFLEALIAIESISLKHLQFVEIATKKDPILEKINILPLVVDYDVFLDSLTYILGVSKETSEYIFDKFIYDDKKKKYYSHIGSPVPLFIRISSTQLLRSFTGCIHRPIDFMLSELKRQYSIDWDRNTREREQLFRNELYKYFDDKRFITFDRSIDISDNGRIITDIDACILDKETGDIAFIQLKWQDSIYESTRSFISKRKNYIEKSKKWVNDIEQWINTVSEKRMADFLQLSPQLINKDKIKLFVIGRHNGNYSGDEKPYSNTAWCQWYNLLELIGTLTSESITITKLFELIQEESPYNQKNEIKTSEIIYGNYSVELVAPPYNQA
ncbi:hypothetical protein [Paenibacillus polymyxa]|uniref:hypothetical protein n=1 Tax=Paenibacillus polymyxa TaxID=1406 RepID=UPI0005781674|nr:hypothetical protein [Paenibacillus polymyxa]PNQ84887.1 hypothetical protein C1T20_17535 [Paenibacillus polymyxa]UMR36667.1 hypothetical protein MJ749_04355 [Paenibacillus polymyxa]UNL95501.1 hypothetical protein CPY53_19085 [Paenibacillus polymyxa]